MRRPVVYGEGRRLTLDPNYMDYGRKYEFRLGKTKLYAIKKNETDLNIHQEVGILTWVALFIRGWLWFIWKKLRGKVG